jgi:hypothetical protein
MERETYTAAVGCGTEAEETTPAAVFWGHSSQGGTKSGGKR